MIALALASLLLGDFELGEFEMTGSSTDLSYLGWHGEPASADQSKALTTQLSQAVRRHGWRLRSVERARPAVDDLAQQQALELEVLLGLSARAAARAQGILQLHLGRPSRLLRSHQRSCRLFYSAAAAFAQNTQQSATKLMLGGLAGCAETGLVDQGWSNDELRSDWRKQRLEGEASLTITASIPGAHAYLDGLFLGGLPVSVTGIPAGRHQLQLVSGDAGRAMEVDLKPGQQHEVQLVEAQHGLAGLSDAVVHPADLDALAKNLPRGVRRGLIVVGRRTGITALVFSKRKAMVVEAAAADELAAQVHRALKSLKPLPAKGISLLGVRPAVGIRSSQFDRLRAQASTEDLPPPDQRLVEGMVAYASKATGRSPDELRQKISASQGNRQWRMQRPFWLAFADVELSPASDTYAGGGLAGLRLSPSPLNGVWWVIGSRLHAGGAGAQPTGDDWDPMRYPVDPITAVEPTLNERIRMDAQGMYGLEGLLGLGFRVTQGAQLVVLAEGGWRQIRADLVHEQYVEGEADSAQVLRRTGDFNWAGARFGARLLGWYPLKGWTVGASIAWSQTRFPNVELDLIIPAGEQGLRAGLVFGRRF